MNLDVPPIAIQRDRHMVFRHNQRATLTLRDIGNFGDSTGKRLTKSLRRNSTVLRFVKYGELKRYGEF